MTRHELALIYRILVKERDAKKLEVTSARTQALESEAFEPKLSRALAEYNKLENLVNVINHDLDQLEGVGPGELFDRVSSQPLQDTQEIADGIRNINATLTRILFCLQFHL